jgi:hypothetical protein
MNSKKIVITFDQPSKRDLGERMSLHTTSTPLRNMLTFHDMQGGCDELGGGRIQGYRLGRPASEQAHGAAG